MLLDILLYSSYIQECTIYNLFIVRPVWLLWSMCCVMFISLWNEW